jgi:ubiquinone biosynthesis protein COQ9
LQLDAAEASTVRYDAWHQSAVRTVSKYRRWSQALQERIGRLGREERAVRAAQSAATFRSVAKELLDPETYARIVAETTRRERAEHDG